MECLFFLCLVVLMSAVYTSGRDAGGHDMHNALEKYVIQNVRNALDEEIQLSTSHTTLEKSGQWVDVSWKGVQDPQEDHFIALYAPANVSIYKTSPVKYQWAVRSPSHRTGGAGSIR